MKVRVAKEQGERSTYDFLKWFVVAVLVIAGVVGNSVYAELSLLYRVIALLILTGIAIFIMLQTAKGATFFVMFKEAQIEIRKVVWPNRQETMQTTLIVVVVVFITGLILWGLDSFFSWVVAELIG